MQAAAIYNNNYRDNHNDEDPPWSFMTSSPNNHDITNDNAFANDSDAVADLEAVELRSLLTLHDACRRGDLTQVKSLIHHYQTSSTSSSAASSSASASASSLSFDVNQQLDAHGWTPLHHAIKAGHVHVCEYLVDHWGAEIRGGEGESPECRHALNDAIQAGHLPVVRLLQPHLDLDRYADENGLRAIHFAALGGHLNMVQYLMEEQQRQRQQEQEPQHDDNDNDSDVYDDEFDMANVGDEDGWTPLHYACLAGDLPTVQYLVEYEKKQKKDSNYCCYSTVEATEIDGWVPLHCAANKGNTSIVKYLLEECDADTAKRVHNVEQTALHLASSEGRLETVQYLIESSSPTKGFSVFDVSSERETSLHLACIYGKLSVVQYLIQQEPVETKSKLLFAKNCRGHTAYEAAVHALEKVERALMLESDDDDDDDNIYKDEDDVELQRDLPAVIEYMYSCVAPLAVPGAADGDSNKHCAAVKLNPYLNNERDAQLAIQTLQIVQQTDVHSVAYHILGFLCLADVQQIARQQQAVKDNCIPR